jgi:hypothetical protein
LPNLSKSTIEDQNHRIPATIQMTNAAEMTDGGNKVAFDYGTDLSKVPSSCLPSNTKTGQKNIGLSNYTHLTASAKKDWPNLQTTSERDAPGLDAGGTTTTTANDGDACEGSSNTGLEWVLCAGLRAIGGFADSVNDLIDSQLNFDIDQNLNVHVKQAWSIFRIISTVLLVIIMLVMILAQASGGGPFEAYTVRKILPKIVIAIIAIQLSWVMLRYVVELANDAGNGIQDLLSVPFGGHNQLQLSNLVGDLGWGAPGATLLVGLFSATAALIINPFGALMLLFLIAVGIVIAFAVLLFRQALIIGCIIFAPIALVAWILPGTNRYWKMWWENFYKALLLFPLIAAMLIIGRVFAWIVANGGGNPGPLDLFAIVLGFFGPYFLLPKAFSWGGSLMKSAANAIEGGIKPIREKGKEEVKGMKERQQGKWASKYDPDKNRQGRVRGGLLRMRSGNFIPTQRGRRLTIQKGEKWKGERDEEAQAQMKRQYDIGLTEGYYKTDPKTGKKEFMEPGLAAAKQGLVDMVGYGGDNEHKKRTAKMAIDELLRTQSYWEMQNAYIGAEGKYNGMRIQDTDVWQGRLQSNPDAWGQVSPKRPDTIPTVTGEEYGQTDQQIADTVRQYAPERRRGADGEFIETAQEYEERIKPYVQRRVAEVKELQSKLGPKARLTDADRLTKSLRAGYASAASSAGYAEGWWDEINNQIDAGNTAAQEEMLNQFIQLAGTGQGALGVLNQLATGEVRDKVNKAIGGSKSDDRLAELITAARSNPDEAKGILTSLRARAYGTPAPTTASTAAPAGTVTPSGANIAPSNAGTAAPAPVAAATAAAGTSGVTTSGASTGAGAPGVNATPDTAVAPEFNFEAMTEAVARGLERGERRASPPRTVQTDLGEIKIEHGQSHSASTQTESGLIIPPTARYDIENPPKNPGSSNPPSMPGA